MKRSELESFLEKRINDCEDAFMNKGTNPDMVMFDAVTIHEAEVNAFLMILGRRQAYTEILELLKRRRLF